MGSKDVYYSYDVDTDEIVAKSRFNDDKTIDRWEGINNPGYSHDVYHDSEEYAGQGKGSVYSRSIGQNPSKQWQDRDHVMDNNSTNSNTDKMSQARAQYMQDNPKQDQQTNNTDMTQAANQYTQDNPVSGQQQASNIQSAEESESAVSASNSSSAVQSSTSVDGEEASNGTGSNSSGETSDSNDDDAIDGDDDSSGTDDSDDDGDCE